MDQSANTILDRLFRQPPRDRSISSDSLRPLTSYAKLVLYILHYRKADGLPDGIPTRNYYKEFGISYHLVKQAIESLTERKICSVNYLGRFSGNYHGRLIPIFNYRCSLPFCAGNFHLRNEGLLRDAPAYRWRRWSSLSHRTVHPIARTTYLM